MDTGGMPAVGVLLVCAQCVCVHTCGRSVGTCSELWVGGGKEEVLGSGRDGETVDDRISVVVGN